MENQRSGEPRADKVAIVTEVKDRIEQSSAVLVTEYRGLTVKHLAELRRSLRPAGGAYKVYKNSLVRRAADDAGVDLGEHLIGPTALTFTEQTPEGEPGDVVTVAKVLRDFAKANPKLLIKGGYFDGQADRRRWRQGAGRRRAPRGAAGQAGRPHGRPDAAVRRLLQALPRNFAYGLQGPHRPGRRTRCPRLGRCSGRLMPRPPTTVRLPTLLRLRRDAPAADAEAANDGAADDAAPAEGLRPLMPRAADDGAEDSGRVPDRRPDD